MRKAEMPLPPVPVVGTGQHGEEIRYRRQRDVVLMPIQEVVPIPRGHGPSFQCRGIGFASGSVRARQPISSPDASRGR